MSNFVRAEDFDIGDGYLQLGIKKVRLSSVLAYQMNRRVSGEFLGFGGLLVFLAIAFIAVIQTPSLSILAVIAAGIFCSMGMQREIQRPYVLVLDLYQTGIFEVRGFGQEEAISVEALLIEGLKKGSIET